MSWIRKERGRAGLSFPTFIAGSAIENVGGGHCPPDNPSVGFADTSLYTREAIRCGGEGPMSTRKGQAASVTLLRREQLRSASAPTNMSEVRQKIEEAGGQGRPPLQDVSYPQNAA